jgi:hypothetical protein
MSAARIDQAMTRINAAMARIDAARLELSSASDETPTDAGSEPANTPRVMALVNAHEKLREEVADTIGEIDALIEELDGE